MTCKCNALNPWRRLRECPDEPSIFLRDGSYTRAADQGVTMSQIATRTVTTHEEKTGRSLGSMYGLSGKGDAAVVARQDQRMQVRKARKG